jgi:CRISPR system Cascade subunit CasD
MGIDKHAPDEGERLAPLAACRFSVFPVAIKKTADPVQLLEDFHTVGGGYDRNDPVEKLRIARKASGGTSTTIITRRFYLEQARFVVVIEGERGVLEKAVVALTDPVWGVWFGRKCCLPAAPLLPTLGPSACEVLEATLAKTESHLVGAARIEEGGDGSWWQSDQPVSFGRRQFLSRPVIRRTPDP